MNVSSSSVCGAGTVPDVCSEYLACEKKNAAAAAAAAGVDSDRVIRIKILTDFYGKWISSVARDFEEYRRGSVIVEVVDVPWEQILDDVVNEAVSKIGLYDGFVTAPNVGGSVAGLDGWADLTSFIGETLERIKDWSDILLGYRKYIAQYEEQIIMYPLDGDLLSLFYRKDILDHFKLTVPRTWDEYSHVAQQTHGKVFENKTLVGSCVGRDCANDYWLYLLLSQMTQTHGSWSGHVFDTRDMKPLTGPALEQAIKWLEDHVTYGPEDEHERCVELNTEYMNGGQCVLTYNWGNSFKRYLENGTMLRGDKFGVAPTPGSTKVLDRETMQLVNCDKDRCKYGTYYEDIGWVNRAPNLAFGGYACSVNNYADPVRKRIAMEFCAFAASQKESIKPVIPNATEYDATLNGQDPFRRSHLNLDLFVQQGYERTASEDYIETILAGLDSVNAVVDLRFPTAADIGWEVGVQLDPYLNATRYGLIPESEREATRLNVARTLERRWKEIMDDYESQATSQPSILEAYQRLRGVYSINNNYLGSIRAYGYVLVAVAIGSSLVSAIWVLKHRKTHIVRASQPFFLVLISLGAGILGSSIIPMGIDDGVASVENCSRACMAIPWLLVLGWTIVFAALFSKLVRMCMVFNSAARFRRVTVTEKDVLHYFAILLACNLVLLLVWTFVTPMEWTRIQTSRTESYGKCVATGDKVAWHTIISLVTVVNGVALIMANVQAYRARRISTEYGESRYIAMAMVSILQVVLVGIPVLFLVDNNPMARYFMQCSIAFVICMSILLWMYVPKMKAWWFQRNERATPTSTPGLAFRLNQSSTFNMNSVQSLQELQDIKIKLAALKGIMEEQGINAAALFKEAGLVEDEKSLRRNETSRVRLDPQNTDERPGGPAGQSTLSSGRRSSGISGSGSSTRKSFGGSSNRNLQPVMEISSNSEEPMKSSSCIDESNKTAAPETKPSEIEPTSGTCNGALNEESNKAAAPEAEPSEMAPEAPPP